MHARKLGRGEKEGGKSGLGEQGRWEVEQRGVEGGKERGREKDEGRERGRERGREKGEEVEEQERGKQGEGGKG